MSRRGGWRASSREQPACAAAPRARSVEPPLADLTTPPLSAAEFLRAARVQLRVTGALMLRELHTRFGRHNIGYLWLVAEPLILSLGISVIHLIVHVELPFGFEPTLFYATGYIVFIMFRNNVNRAVTTIEGNKPLLYHRLVTLFDIVAARTLLDIIAVFGAMIVVCTLFVLSGLGDVPERPEYIALSLALMAWYSWGMAMFVAAAMEFSPAVERIVHPSTYLIIPFSGMLYVLDALPPQLADVAKWVPLPQITDLARMGLRADFQSTFVNLPYIMLHCACATLLGGMLLRIARRRIHFE